MRHPFERIVSAYNDKMTTNEGQTGHYNEVSRLINKKYKILRDDPRDRTEPDDGLATFEDFVNHLVRLGSPWNRDEHWRQYETICDPCHHNYDVIMKFDTFYDEFKYIKKYLNVSERHLKAFFPPWKHRTNPNVTSVYMESIPRTLRHQLYEVYKKDFELFGYEKPSYVL